MNKLLLFYIAFITLDFSSSAVIHPYLSLNLSADLQAVEPDAKYVAPDPRLEVHPSFLGNKLPMISCLMGILDILISLGLDDWGENIPTTSWTLPEYAQVSFSLISTATGGQVERRFVMWALGLVADLMINLNKFESVSFLVTWNKAAVAQLLILNSSQGKIALANGTTQSLIQQSATTAANVSSITPSYLTSGDVLKITDDKRLTIRTSLVGSALDVQDVFRMVFAVIVGTAEQKSTEQIQEYVSPKTVPRVILSFFPPVPAPTQPPFFEVRWLVRTVASIPTYMIKKGQFRELLLLLEVDGSRVADGFLEGKQT